MAGWMIGLCNICVGRGGFSTCPRQPVPGCAPKEVRRRVGQGAFQTDPHWRAATPTDMCQLPAAQAGQRPAHPGGCVGRGCCERLDVVPHLWFAVRVQERSNHRRQDENSEKTLGGSASAPSIPSMALSLVMLLQPSDQSSRGSDGPNLLAGVGS